MFVCVHVIEVVLLLCCLELLRVKEEDEDKNIVVVVERSLFHSLKRGSDPHRLRQYEPHSSPLLKYDKYV